MWSDYATSCSLLAGSSTMSMIGIIDLVLVVVECGLALLVGYLLFLTGAALCAPHRTPLGTHAPIHRFAILIPAHNEEQLLPGLLDNLQRLDYPQALYAIHVVADNCTDHTAELARQAQVTVHERTDSTRIGKGYALEWLIERLWAQDQPFDAFLILDADSIVSENFLAVMDARLAGGAQAIQAYYAVRDPAGSWNASLRAVALAALHYLRPLGRSVIGCSAGLKGNGMVFSAGMIKQYRWSAALTEDIEYHMALVLGGHRVAFAPDAIVWAEMPSSLAASQTQQVRWERGRQEMLRQYVPRLLRAAVARRSFRLLDAAIEQIIPPFSLLAALSLVCLALGLIIQSRSAVGIALGLLVAQAIYIFAGLLLARAPRRVYQALLYAPLFIAWKAWLYLRVSLGFDRKGWTRTARNDT